VAEGWKAWVKQLAPPILLEAVRPAAGSTPVWSGVYAHRREVPTHRDEYSGELIDEMVATTSAALSRVRSGRKPYLWHEPFALVAGALALRVPNLRVLDFGGATGSGYVQLLSSLPRGARVEYLVVDSAVMCEAGRSIFAGDARIRFSETLPPAGAVDLVYVNGVFPYIDDYAAKIGELAALDAEQIFLARLAAGANPTFASRQLNLPGRVFAYWFLNLDEVTSILSRAGYQLACDSFVDGHYDQSNLPETHRVERFRNVLYAKQS
jgi:putative methyltransferase (TIGR04325 family)